MSREKHDDRPRPVFRVATRLCINCGVSVVYAIPHATPPAIVEEVIGKAMDTHKCQDVLPPLAKPAWGRK